jgi:uncharacterized protein YggU (UPF0235/DUF167 family)
MPATRRLSASPWPHGDGETSANAGPAVIGYHIDMIELRMQEGAVILPVKVVPGASRTRFMGEWQGRAKFAVAAAAEKGKANEALTGYLAELVGVRPRDVSIEKGTTTVSEARVRDSLKAPRSDRT